MALVTAGWRGLARPVGVIAASGALAALVWRSVSPKVVAAEEVRPGKAASAKSADRPVPVQTAVAKAADLRVVQNGLGTVVPRHSVTVRSRVKGQLLRVSFEEGQLVKQGQLLAEVDPRPFQAALAQVEGQLARDRAVLENAKLDLQRYRALRQESIAKQEDVDSKESLVKQYEGTLRIGHALAQQAALELSFSRVTAPISGRIGLRKIDAGNNVDPADAEGLATINAVQPISVVFALPEDAVPAVFQRLQAVQKAQESLPVEAWDKGSRSLLARGKLLTLDNQIEPGTGTIKLKAEFPNEEGSLFPNQFVNVRLLVETRSGATVVPQSAIQHGSSGPFVYLVSKEKTVTVKTVQPGTSDGPVISVERGLSPGDVVVTGGADRLRDGAKVTLAAEGGAAGKRVGGPGKTARSD